MRVYSDPRGGRYASIGRVAIKDLHVPGRYEYRLVIGELQIPETFLRHLHMNRAAPLRNRFDLNQGACSIDVFNGCAEVSFAVWLSADFERVWTHIYQSAMLVGGRLALHRR